MARLVFKPFRVSNVSATTEVANVYNGETFVDASTGNTYYKDNSTGAIKKGTAGALASIGAWQYETQAEIMRGMGQSGLYQTRQYTYGGPKAFNRPWVEGYNAANMHNHPNYDGMPGTAEFSVIVNGYYLRTRHNDYRLRGPNVAETGYLSTVATDGPVLPTSINTAGTVTDQITSMKSLFQSYQNNAFPAGFGWTLSYVELWFEAYTDTVSETFDSFRHQQYVTTVDAALREALKFNYGGYKNSSENTSFEIPIVRIMNSSGEPVYARLRYRMAAVDVSSLGDLRPHLKQVDDLAESMRTRGLPSRYEITDNVNAPGMLDTLMAKIPGLDGTNANLTEMYGTSVQKEYNSETVANSAYYHRFNNASTLDASNRSNFRRGFNDPMLFTALTTRAEVCPMVVGSETYRFSYAIPFELVLRTPLERWNPFKIPELASVTGAGTSASPYNGFNKNNFFNMTPAAFYTGGSNFTDAADTGSGIIYTKDSAGQTVQVRGSGIYVTLPTIADIGNVRIRYPIFPVFHEGSHAYGQVEALKKVLSFDKVDMGSNPFISIDANASF